MELNFSARIYAGGRRVVLVVGDTHIPERAWEIDEAILDFLRPRRYDVVVHTGDLVGEEVLDVVRGLGARYYVVQGNMDYLDLPEEEVFDVFGIKMGVIHGDQARPRGDIEKLTLIASRLGVSVLMSGHTHSPFIVFHPRGVLHVNPGSLTGVWGGGGGSMTPSFAEIEVYESGVVVVKLYELVQNRVVLRREEVFRFTVG